MSKKDIQEVIEILEYFKNRKYKASHDNGVYMEYYIDEEPNKKAQYAIELLQALATKD